MAVIVSAVATVVSIIVSTVVAVGTIIWTAAIVLASTIWEGVTLVAGALTWAVGSVVKAVVGTVSAISSTIYKYLYDDWTKQEGIIRKIANFLKSDLGKLITRVVGVIIKTRDNVKIKISDMISIIGSVGDVIGKEWLSDLARGVENYLALAKAIADGNTEALLMTINDLWLAIAGTSADMVDLLVETIDTVWKELYDTQDGFVAYMDKRIDKFLEPAGKIMKAVSDFIAPALTVLEGDIELEISRVKGDLTARLNLVEAENVKIIALTEDLEHFGEMLIKTLGR